MQYKQLIRNTLGDRPYLAIMLSVFAIAIVGALFVLFAVEPRDKQIYTQYSSFGEVHYYKGKWYSLYAFAAAFVAIAIGHNMLMLKFRSLDRRDFGLIFGIGTIVVLVVGIIYVANVIGQIAFI